MVVDTNMYVHACYNISFKHMMNVSSNASLFLKVLCWIKHADMFFRFCVQIKQIAFICCCDLNEDQIILFPKGSDKNCLVWFPFYANMFFFIIIKLELCALGLIVGTYLFSTAVLSHLILSQYIQYMWITYLLDINFLWHCQNCNCHVCENICHDLFS